MTGAGLSYSDAYQQGYFWKCMNDYTHCPNHHQYSRLNHEGLQLSRNVAEWLAGGLPGPGSGTPTEVVGTCNYGYSERVGVRPDDPAVPAKVTASNPRETIRVLDYDYFVSSNEDGPEHVAARHGGRANVLFIDGHVEALTPEEIMDPSRRLWAMRK